MRESQKALFEHGLDTVGRANRLIEDIWNFLADPPVPIRYLATCADKDSAWRKFSTDQFAKWQSMQDLPKPERVGQKPLRAELSNLILERAFEYLLQRIDYLGGERPRRDPNPSSPWRPHKLQMSNLRPRHFSPTVPPVARRGPMTPAAMTME